MTMPIIPHDMPKLESPFAREMINGQYVVTPKIAEGYEWVFNDDSVLATEKLDGTNVSIVIENGTIASVWNRMNRLLFFSKGKKHIMEGLLESFDKGYCDLPDGQWFGELIGEKVNGNPLKIEGHLWVPFSTYAREHLAYKSWGKYPKTFDSISQWFEKDLFSLFIRRRTGEIAFPEGIVFIQPSTGKLDTKQAAACFNNRMAKLRRDMFPWAKAQGLDIHKSLSEK